MIISLLQCCFSRHGQRAVQLKAKPPRTATFAGGNDDRQASSLLPRRKHTSRKVSALLRYGDRAKTAQKHRPDRFTLIMFRIFKE
jgi:hypothetical protein